MCVSVGVWYAAGNLQAAHLHALRGQAAAASPSCDNAKPALLTPLCLTVQMPAANAVAALVQSVTQLQLLQQLSALTSLSASALADEGLSALAQLRRLRHLDIERAKGLTVPGMSLLTAMTGLTELRGPALAAPLSASHHGRLVHLRSHTVSRGPGWAGACGVV